MLIDQLSHLPQTTLGHNIFDTWLILILFLLIFILVLVPIFHSEMVYSFFYDHPLEVLIEGGVCWLECLPALSRFCRTQYSPELQHKVAFCADVLAMWASSLMSCIFKAALPQLSIGDSHLSTGGYFFLLAAYILFFLNLIVESS